MTDLALDRPAPAPASPAERWRKLPVGARVAVLAVTLLVGFNVLIAGIDLAAGGPAPAGPPSSSYATAPEGLAAYADLLAEYGHPVRRLRTALDDAGLRSGDTVVVADPTPLTGGENRALRRFVEDGGRLVAAGAAVVPSLRHILGRAPAWDDDGARSAHPLVPVPEVADVSLVRSAGRGSWSDAGASLPVLAGDANGGSDPDADRNGTSAGAGSARDAPAPPATVATVASVGAGRVVALADASVLHNALLGQADNAAFAVALAGERGRPVAFAEAAHGYGQNEGLGAIPPRWRWALVFALAATLVWMWSRGRRHGPPEDSERRAAPPRRAYVDALAASLARTRQPARSVQPLQDAARRRISRRAGLPPDPDEEALRRAAVQLGVPAEEVAALFAAPGDDRDLMAVGRATTAALSAGAGRPDQERRPW